MSKLYLFKTLLTKGDDVSKTMTSTELGKRGQFYSGVNANIDPLSFMARIDSKGTDFKGAFDLDFSDIIKHDFLAGDKALPPNYISEIEVSEFLGRLVYAMNAAKVVEIGCYVGVTSAYVAKALKTLRGERHLYCVDIDRRFLDLTTRNLSSLSLLEGFHPVLGNSLDSDIVHGLPVDADVIFIDSSHEYEPTCREILIYSEKILPSGCMVLHDSIQWPGVRTAVQDIGKNFDLMTFATRRGNGVTVMMKKQDLR